MDESSKALTNKTYLLQDGECISAKENTPKDWAGPNTWAVGERGRAAFWFHKVEVVKSQWPRALRMLEERHLKGRWPEFFPSEVPHRDQRKRRTEWAICKGNVPQVTLSCGPAGPFLKRRCRSHGRSKWRMVGALIWQAVIGPKSPSEFHGLRRLEARSPHVPDQQSNYYKTMAQCRLGSGLHWYAEGISCWSVLQDILVQMDVKLWNLFSFY